MNAFKPLHTRSMNFRFDFPKVKPPAALAANPQLMDATIPGFSFGTMQQPFAQEILYHKLFISQSSTPPTYSYLAGSGVFRNYTDIDLFMSVLEDNPGSLTPTRGLYNMAGDAPNILVRYPCYVVIELNGPPTLSFWQNHVAIDTASDWGDKYCSLTHYDTSWEASADNDTGDQCFVVSFGVQTPAASGNDPFNIYFQSGQVPNIMYSAVDPAIKNRGPKSG